VITAESNIKSNDCPLSLPMPWCDDPRAAFIVDSYFAFMRSNFALTLDT